jgi:hypothetical protein
LMWFFKEEKEWCYHFIIITIDRFKK